MTNVEDGSKAVNRYAKVNQLLLDTYSTRCLDFKYQSFIDQLKDTSFNKTSVPGGKVFLITKFDLIVLICLRPSMDISNVHRIWIFPII